MPVLSQAGGSLPANCSGLGRAGLVDRPLGTRTSPVALRRELVAIPDRGWALEREEGNIGMSFVTAALFGPLGEVVAALSVTGPTAIVRANRVGPAARMAAAGAARAYATRR